MAVTPLRLMRELSQLLSVLPRVQQAIVPAATLADVDRGLAAHKPRVLHFAGHSGDLDPSASSAGSLLFETAAAGGAGDDAAPAEVVALLRRACAAPGCRLECVFLNCCGGAPLGRRIVRALPQLAVVCWSTVAENGAARSFARGFYTALAAGCTDDDGEASGGGGGGGGSGRGRTAGEGGSGAGGSGGSGRGSSGRTAYRGTKAVFVGDRLVTTSTERPSLRVAPSSSSGRSSSSGSRSSRSSRSYSSGSGGSGGGSGGRAAASPSPSRDRDPLLSPRLASPFLSADSGATAIVDAFDGARASFEASGFRVGDPAAYLHPPRHPHHRIPPISWRDCFGCVPPVHGECVLMRAASRRDEDAAAAGEGGAEEETGEEEEEEEEGGGREGPRGPPPGHVFIDEDAGEE